MTMPTRESASARPTATSGSVPDSILSTLIVEPTQPAQGEVQCIRRGVPLRQGAARDPSELRWLAERGSISHSQFDVLSRWPDGSIQWLLADLSWTPSDPGRQRFQLVRAAPSEPSPSIEVEETGKGYSVDTGSLQFDLAPAADGSTLIESIRQQDLGVLESLRVEVEDAEGRAVAGRVVSAGIETVGSSRATLYLQGAFGRTPLHFRLRVSAWRDVAHLELDFRFTHSGAAAHRGGCWDLGDANSVHVRAIRLAALLSEPAAEVRYTVDDGRTISDPSDSALVVEQMSSGGERWNSRNHIDARGEVPLEGRGYRVRAGGAALQEQGDRAQPWSAHRLDGGRWLAVGVREFWQNFPIRHSWTSGAVQLELLAAPRGKSIEIQGGESKSHVIQLGVCGSPESFRIAMHPPRIGLDPDQVRDSAVLAHLVTDEARPAWWELVDGAVDGENSFLSKRELVDEFGWRHFGELFADHEAVRSDPTQPIASHYNNQYDPLQCFLRQYLSGGDSRWFELADQLARHLRDIDIYHTTADREEYNGGLFWHTDHYLDAGTCTHRSFSRLHAEVTGRAGGGHSLEHAYSQGLAYHYLLTGDSASKQAVLEIADWVLRLCRGPATLLGTLYRLRKLREPLVEWLRGKSSGYYRFPFNRATGNSVHTMLDANLITADPSYLETAGWLIRNCAGPTDDPAQRDLLNVEPNWSYTVFLDSVLRFLWVKEQHGTRDSDHAHAAALLVRYGRWMAAHEQTYLEQKENLEFPNETWPAQDFRKAKILLGMSGYLPQPEAGTVVERGKELFELAMKQLYEFPEDKRRLTRPVVLLLQNHELYLEALAERRGATLPLPEDPGLARPTFGAFLASQLGYALRRTHPWKEYRWIRTRIQNARA